MKTNNRPHLAFSPGRFVALVVLIAAVLLIFVTGQKVLSPGPLSAQASGHPLGGFVSHAELSCNACHAPPWSQETMATRCLSCHNDVAVESQTPGTLHNIAFSGSAITCQVGCHTEHRGAAASLILTGSKHEDPRGYSLAGHKTKSNGEPFKCLDCHVQSVTKFNVLVCLDCHRGVDAVFAQTHFDTFGGLCLQCHDGIDTYGKRFDHNAVNYKLTGKHVAVGCGGCHANARTIAQLKATPQNCYACHRKDDKHAGSYSQDCAQCHTTSDWAQITVDHNQTSFPLTGKHATVDCKLCHLDNTFLDTPTSCNACHQKDDKHAGSYGQNCAQCHTTADWAQVTLDHSKTAYPLTGKHLTVPCASCHVNKVFKGTPNTCNACHQKDDKHAGSYGQNCAQCHVTSDWAQVTLDHSKTAYPLTGKHLTVPCASCHVNKVFKGTPNTCNACHQNDDKHNGSYGQNCAQCHTTADWAQVTLDHSKTAYPLTGKHLAVPCVSCHVNKVFKGTPNTCNACHQKDDKHAGSYGQNCAQCHTTADWAQVTLDHSKTAYPLTGKHLTVPCASCHVNKVFKGTPNTCYACHQAKDTHKGAFGQNCVECHNTAGWTPATYNRPHTAFPLSHGVSGGVKTSCGTCHPTNLIQYTQYTCYGCHQHTVANILSHHRNTTNLADCMRCHANGRSGG
jgi:hypothetical protein